MHLHRSASAFLGRAIVGNVPDAGVGMFPIE